MEMGTWAALKVAWTYLSRKKEMRAVQSIDQGNERSTQVSS